MLLIRNYTEKKSNGTTGLKTAKNLTYNLTERTNKKFPPFFVSKTENLTGYNITEKREVLSIKYSEWLNIWLKNYVKPTHKIRMPDLYRQMFVSKYAL